MNSTGKINNSIDDISNLKPNNLKPNNLKPNNQKNVGSQQ